MKMPNLMKDLEKYMDDLFDDFFKEEELKREKENLNVFGVKIGDELKERRIKKSTFKK
jgi:hypothetical protein